jgi:3-oxoacyl-[acyl-carrier protein] reductase
VEAVGAAAPLAGRVALVTGGGTGIGAAIATAYAAAGAAVAVVGRRRAPLDAVAATITRAGGRVLVCPGDVTEFDQMTEAAAATVEEFGRLDLVVANAGAAPPFGDVLDADEASWRAIVDLNLTGVWITAKATVPKVIASGGGAFLTIGSGAARANAGGLGSYAAAKAGASALTRVLAAELRAHHVAVNEIVPGPVYTDAISVFGSGTYEEVAARLRTATGEWLKQPDAVAQLALYLATLPPDGTTGQVFSLMGRLT